ncbi:hypothetical protein [Listeria sp. ILCC797]|uniref:hypothetical protein n=1 Tax=Listeria sp. ILCC797 TaxID=1918333 RepID=UPI000B591C62|nr:hypothetical protein [Listeria sp. ILCC797]
MKKEILTVSNILIIILVLVAILTSFLWYKSSSENTNENLNKQVDSLNVSKKNYMESTKTLTTDDISTEITSSNIDVKSKLEKKKADIETVIRKVYGETKTQQDYEHLKNEIVPLVGESFSDKLVELDQPIVSEAGTHFPFEELKTVKVFFGEYNLANQSADCYVLVNYESKANATTTGIESAKKQTNISGQDFFILSYDLADDSLNYQDYQRNITNGGEE